MTKETDLTCPSASPSVLGVCNYSSAGRRHRYLIPIRTVDCGRRQHARYSTEGTMTTQQVNSRLLELRESPQSRLLHMRATAVAVGRASGLNENSKNVTEIVDVYSEGYSDRY